MKTATSVFQWIIRLTGLFQLVLGVIFWITQNDALVPAHILVGSILVASLWIQAILAARAGVGWNWVGLALAWGLVMLVFGLTQAQILPDAGHWVVQVIHLLIGLGAIGQGEGLVVRIRKVQPSAA
jgi:ABC-type multidrug transport system fused ATPase/permease subunit